MNLNTKSAQATTKPTVIERIIKRLTARIEADNEPKHPGVIMSYERGVIDDGAGYGDPMIDTRPEWIRRDEEGWTPLK